MASGKYLKTIDISDNYGKILLIYKDNSETKLSGSLQREGNGGNPRRMLSQPLSGRPG